MTIERDSLFSLPTNLEDQIALRQVLSRLLEQLDLIVGLRDTQGADSYTQVIPSVAYSQSELAQVATDLKTLFDRVEQIEARLVPVNN